MKPTDSDTISMSSLSTRLRRSCRFRYDLVLKAIILGLLVIVSIAHFKRLGTTGDVDVAETQVKVSLEAALMNKNGQIGTNTENEDGHVQVKESMVADLRNENGQVGTNTENEDGHVQVKESMVADLRNENGQVGTNTEKEDGHVKVQTKHITSRVNVQSTDLPVVQKSSDVSKTKDEARVNVQKSRRGGMPKTVTKSTSAIKTKSSGTTSSSSAKKIFTIDPHPSPNHFDGEPASQDLLILQYTEFYHKVSKNDFLKCKYSKCDWTTDISKLNQSTAVLFHMWGGVLRKLGLPKKHPLWQRWIFFTKEAPTRYKFNTWSPMLGAVYHLDLPHLNGAFNMTMTAMSDSDVPFPYGKTAKRDEQVKVNPDYARGKTGKVAWVVSHCNTSSGRENLVKQLQKYVSVDIYGRCGPFDCPEKCFSHLGKKYKFYLALENSDCDDYISEKFWFNAFSYNMVPIVRGRRSNYEKLAPPHSYIHWDKYTVKELANLINKLDKNDNLYNEYFKWKTTYYIAGMSNWMCDLCEYLHKNRRTVKYYTNLQNYWDADIRCER